jgi:basic membrane protein A
VADRIKWSTAAVRLVPVLVTVLALVAAIAPGASARSEQPRARVVLFTFGCTQTDFVCTAFKRVLRRTGMSGRIVSPDSREDLVGTLSLLARQHYDLVIVDFFSADALTVVAPRFPKTQFALFDVPLTFVRGHPPNVQAVVHQPEEAAYLAGWLAARLEQRRPDKDVVGAVGGVRIPSVDDFIVGFRAGARRADPGITVLTGYSGDFTDPNKCDAIARSQIARGAGVVFNVAGACGIGALQAAKQGKVWGIGVDSDQSFLGPHILTSVIKHYDAGFLELLAQVRRGKFRGGGTTVLGLANGGAGLGRISPKVPAALRAELGRVRQEILDGRIRVPRTPRD